jgi:DNA-binding MarR family transcriptional regulator
MARKRKRQSQPPPRGSDPQWRINGVDVEVLNGIVGYNLRRAHAIQRQRFASAFGPYDIRPVQLSVLGLIYHNPSLKQADLGKVLEVKRANVVKLLDELEQRSLITRELSKTDKRSRVLELTDRGAALVAELLERHDRLERDLALQLGEKERTQLLTLLKRFRKIGSPADLDD